MAGDHADRWIATGLLGSLEFDITAPRPAAAPAAVTERGHRRGAVVRSFIKSNGRTACIPSQQGIRSDVADRVAEMNIKRSQ